MIGSSNKIGSIGRSAKRVGTIGKGSAGATGDSLGTGVSGDKSRTAWPTTTTTTAAPTTTSTSTSTTTSTSTSTTTSTTTTTI